MKTFKIRSKTVRIAHNWLDLIKTFNVRYYNRNIRNAKVSIKAD